MPAPKHAGIPRDSEDGAGPNKRHGADLTYRWTDNIEQNLATLRKA